MSLPRAISPKVNQRPPMHRHPAPQPRNNRPTNPAGLLRPAALCRTAAPCSLFSDLCFPVRIPYVSANSELFRTPKITRFVRIPYCRPATGSANSSEINNGIAACRSTEVPNGARIIFRKNALFPYRRASQRFATPPSRHSRTRCARLVESKPRRRPMPRNPSPPEGPCL